MLSPLLALVLAAAAGSAGPPSPAARVEAFLVERSGPEGPEPVAVVVMRRLAGPGRLLLEQDVTFRAGGATVLHDEVLEPGGWSFVRRELRGPESPGRSWSGEPDGAGGLRLLRWGLSVSVHETWAAPAPRLPLEFLEASRSGREPAGRISLFEPMAEAVVPVDVRIAPGDPRDGFEEAGTRTIELWRADGSLAGRYVLHGPELVAFQWQDGERWARRVELEEALRLAADWRPDHDPLAEVWAALRAGRVRRR